MRKRVKSKKLRSSDLTLDFLPSRSFERRLLNLVLFPTRVGTKLEIVLIRLERA